MGADVAEAVSLRAGAACRGTAGRRHRRSGPGRRCGPRRLFVPVGQPVLDGLGHRVGLVPDKSAGLDGDGFGMRDEVGDERVPPVSSGVAEREDLHQSPVASLGAGEATTMRRRKLSGRPVSPTIRPSASIQACADSGGVVRTPTHQIGHVPSARHTNAVAMDRGRHALRPAQRGLTAVTSSRMIPARAYVEGREPRAIRARSRLMFCGGSSAIPWAATRSRRISRRRVRRGRRGAGVKAIGYVIGLSVRPCAGW